jgi:hypothetical protein
MNQLSSPPGLLSLYAKAAVTGPLHKGDTLPDSRYALAAQTTPRIWLHTNGCAGSGRPTSCHRRICTCLPFR